MELYQEMYFKIKGTKETVLSNEEIVRILENESYKALSEIRDIIRDTSCDDDECFDKIEKIVCIFEKLGSNGGFRHDFG